MALCLTDHEGEVERARRQSPARLGKRNRGWQRATVDFDMARGPEGLKVFQDGKTSVVTCPGPDGYVREVEHVLSQILAGARSAQIAPEEGLHAVQICEAEERSVRSGRVELVAYD